jgi:putative intracellular protease/amidase
MAEQLRGTRVAILAPDGVERVELEQPRDALQRAGAQTDLLSYTMAKSRRATTTSNRLAHFPSMAW